MRHKESIELINIKSKMTCFQFRRSVMASATLTAWGWCQIQIPDLTFQFCRRTTLQTTSPSRNRRSRLTTFWSRWFKKLFGLQLTDAQTRRANRNLIEIKMCSKIMRKITSIYGSIDLSVTAKKFCSIGSCNVGVALWRPVWRRPKKSLKTSFKVLLLLLTHVSLLISKFTFLFFYSRRKTLCRIDVSQLSVNPQKAFVHTSLLSSLASWCCCCCCRRCCCCCRRCCCCCNNYL